ncbi:MAG: class I SAM-dependent methyltransferase [Polyangiaceae bacterium]|nr:class I SAM-dependent methyltransferase [Polyangiaceae bacterium]
MSAFAQPKSQSTLGNAAEINHAVYEQFWQDCPDFVRFNPGARHRRRIVREWLAGLPGGTLCDVGCGNGELLVSLIGELGGVSEFFGVDLSPTTIVNNRERLPMVAFDVLNIEEQALPRAFDIIVCSEVLEHLDDRDRAFKHLASMLTPNGHLLVTTPTGKVHATERHFGHTVHPTLPELESLGAANGLRRVRAINWGFPLYRALKWATNLDSERALKAFASGRYGALQKNISNALFFANYANARDSSRGCQLFVLFRKAA